MENFYIGQDLGLNYAPEAAVWCNRNNAVLHTTRHARRQVTAVVSGTNQEDIRLMVFKEVC